MDAISEQIRAAVVAWGPRVLAAAATLVVGWLAAQFIAGGLRRAMIRARLDVAVAGFLSSLARFALITVVVIVALGELGVETTTFAAVVGAAGLAVGLSLQGQLANLAGGVIILTFRPFEVGNYVDAGGTAGTVKEVGVFATILNTPDNKRVIVPNKEITSATITNYSANDTRRLDLVFGIGYGDSIREAKEIFERVVTQHPKVLAEPAPVIRVLELADSSVNFAVRPWVATADYWDLHFDLVETIKQELDARGISIPFPQRDVHLHRVDSTAV